MFGIDTRMIFDTDGKSVNQKFIDISSVNANAEVLAARGTYPTLAPRLDNVDASMADNTSDLNIRGINLRKLGAKLDGIADDYQIVMNALATYTNVICPADGIIGTSQTIVVGQGQSLIGSSLNSRGYGHTAKIKYIGAQNNHLAVVRLGRNAVDAEPALDGTDIQFRNFIVDGNNLAGFGVYGTYLTNDSVVENIFATNTLEYGMFFAQSWYATYNRLIAKINRGQGLAFGMPLTYLDGTSITWTATGEMNNCIIQQLRAESNGQYYSITNPNTYNPTNASIRRKGYGIGFGKGNSFNVDKFTSEANGGVGLYVYTDFQPLKTIKKGYMERNCSNSGLDPATTMATMIIENVNTSGGPIRIEDVFMNYNSGGIYHTGVLGRKVYLKNIQQPRFLSSLDGLTSLQLYAEVLKDSVYFGCGYYNTLESLGTGGDSVQTVNSRYSFTVNANYAPGYKAIYIKGDGTTPWGSYTINFGDGTTKSLSFPSGLGTSYVLSTVESGNIATITKSGGTGGTDSNVTFKLVNMPNTSI